MSIEIILFIIGFILGGGLIWFLRQKELDSVKQNQEELRQVFGDLSNEALVESQKNFLELAEHKFSSLLENSDNQLDKNFPVINEKGLVGKIIIVTKNNSKVLLITDQNSAVPVRSMNREFYAVMTGSKDGKYLISSFIKDNQKPLIGEILITSGRVNIYPKNILVGQVIGISNEKVIAVPFVDTKNLEFVQIIKNN